MYITRSGWIHGALMNDFLETVVCKHLETMLAFLLSEAEGGGYERGYEKDTREYLSIYCIRHWRPPDLLDCMGEITGRNIEIANEDRILDWFEVDKALPKRPNSCTTNRSVKRMAFQMMQKFADTVLSEVDLILQSKSREHWIRGTGVDSTVPSAHCASYLEPERYLVVLLDLCRHARS